jgi:hypothetical protein
MAKASVAQGVQDDKKSKVPQSDFPIFSLEQAARIANGLWDNFAGKDTEPHQLAVALDMSPTSGTWRNLCGSALGYGLTTGGYGATSIALTELGRKIVTPLADGDDISALRDACMKPRIMGEFFRRYDKAKMPRDEIAQNVLISLGLPKERAPAALDVLKRNGEKCGLIIETKTGPFVALSGAGATSALPRETEHLPDNAEDYVEDVGGGGGSSEEVTNAEVRKSPKEPVGPRQIFVAHGKNMKPVEELRKILDQFKIPYKIAVEEPNSGRPISAKVATLMKSCTAGIFVFTKDESFTNANGEEIWRPSENVVYELGAGNIEWGSKIIVLKESGVNFASDYQDIGYITFEGSLSAKALEVIRELIGLGIVQVQAV